MSIQITSDGTVAGTDVRHAVTGQFIEARRVEVIFDVVGGIFALVTFSKGGEIKKLRVESIKFNSGPSPVTEARQPVKTTFHCKCGRPFVSGTFYPVCPDCGRPTARKAADPCPECGGTGEVQLFTSTVPCSRGCKR